MSNEDKAKLKLDKELQEYAPLKDTDNKEISLKEDNIESTTIKNSIITEIKEYLLSYIKPFNLKKFIITILASIIAYYLYYISLEGCFEGEGPCSANVPWMTVKIIEDALSIIIIYVLTILSILKIISKLHFIHMYIIFRIFIQKYKGDTFDKHGTFNSFYSAAFYIILLAVSFPFLVIYFLAKKKKKKSIIVFIIAFPLLFLLIFTGFKRNVGCVGWEKGLNNSFIENDEQKYGCQIQFPKFCPQKIISKYYDKTKKRKITCLKRIDEDKYSLKRQNITNKITNETKRIGFSFYEISESLGSDDLLKQFEKYLVDMDNKTVLEKIGNYNKPELVVDYTSNPLGELNINLNYREKLSQERKLLEKNSNPYYKNVLIIYIDSLSRVQSVRSLKKTMSFIEKFMPYEGGKNPKFPSENYHSFQFFKYYSHDFNTYGNYPQMYQGRESWDKSGKKTRIMKSFKDNGYVTGLSSDSCLIEPTSGTGKRKGDFFDHLSYLCSKKFKGTSTDTIRCLYGDLKIKHILEYGKQFWKAYKNNRKFLFILSHDAHEITEEVMKYSDEPIYDFLNNLFDENLLKDTAITIVSDHGLSLGPYSLFYDFFLKEYRLPMFYMILNDRKNVTYEEQYKFININQQSLITAYDYYNTLSHFIYGDDYVKIPNKTDEVEYPKSSKGVSLFMEIDQMGRNPKNYSNMSSSYCT